MGWVEQTRINLLERSLTGLHWAAKRRGASATLPAHLATGIEGEDAAYFYPRRKGYVVVMGRLSHAGNKNFATALLGAMRVLELLVPGHLNRFKPRLVRFCRVVSESFQIDDIAMQVSEAHRQWVQVRKLLLQLNADLLGVGPVNFAGHPGLSYSSAQVECDELPSSPQKNAANMGRLAPYFPSARVSGLPSET
jgi:hypothetical protein